MAPSKTILITGTSSGIGHSLARLLNSQGHRVLATARKTESISDLSALGVTALALDVDSPESIAALLEEVKAITGGKLDMLINNAGRNLTVPALDLDLTDVESLFRTNLFGVMRMCQSFTPLLIASAAASSSPSQIIQIGSVAGIMPYVFGSAYNASKAALHAYSNTLRLELAPFNVLVTTVVTGGVKSEIARTDRTLREGSLYAPIEPQYVRRTKHSQEVGMETDLYARAVVRQILGVGKPGRQVWAGFGSWLVWFASSFLPSWVMDWYFTREFGLMKLRQRKSKDV